jgi:hypothetical protein
MANLSLTRLANSAKKAGITSEAGFQSLALRLSPHQDRLFTLLLEQGECDTIKVRQQASIGNISECATSLNLKLEAAGDPRRVVCETRPHQNKFGERGVLGHWRLVDVEQAAA